MNKYILWLTSWYPTLLSEYDGDFIQRHARAASLFAQIIVVHFQKDTQGIATKNVSKKINISGNLTEIIIYYHPSKTGIQLLDRILSQLKYHILYRRELKNIIKIYGKPSLIHAHVLIKIALQILWLKKKYSLKLLITEHWTGYNIKAKKNIYNNYVVKKIIKKTLSKATMLLPVSIDLGETINRNLATIPYKEIPNVVDINLFYYVPKKITTFRFIHVSTMNYHKNAEGIIRAAKMLSDEGFIFELMMIGWVTKDLTTLANDLGLTDKVVYFKNKIPYTHVAEEMQHSSAFILFSVVENLPCVILEALCCGLPVISSDVGGINELINKNNGIMVESKNDLQLKDAMKKVIENYTFYNRQLIAKEAAEKFNYTSVGNQFADIYKSSK